jgi:hypothetical protein
MKGPISQGNVPFVDQQLNEPWRHFFFLFTPPKFGGTIIYSHCTGNELDLKVNASNWICRRYLI